MLTFTVSPDGAEPYRVTASSRDVVAWEKTSRGRTLADLATPMMSDLYALAYLASRRQGLFAGNLAEFEAGVDVETEDDDEPDPSMPVPSAGP